MVACGFESKVVCQNLFSSHRTEFECSLCPSLLKKRVVVKREKHVCPTAELHSCEGQAITWMDGGGTSLTPAIADKAYIGGGP